MSDARLYAAAALRNREPILALLRGCLPATGTVLEIASGTGEHVVHFARHLPDLTFQPTDPDENARRSIGGWIAESGLGNVRPPMAFDAAATPWPIASVDAIICINMIHISPWQATLGLLAGAAAALPAGGPLYLYGPYRRRGIATAPSNEAFDDSLRSRDPAWGLRLLEEVVAQANDRGLALDRVVEMPANNLSVVFRKL
jgi:cyclopropane fatty-acyl-phospholipid synthase-like methyltransferase